MSEYDSATLLLSAAGGMILILISAVGFFLKPLLKAIDQLKDAVNELKLIVEIQKSEAKSFNKFCEMKHAVIDKRFEELENSIQ